MRNFFREVEEDYQLVTKSTFTDMPPEEPEGIVEVIAPAANTVAEDEGHDINDVLKFRPLKGEFEDAKDPNERLREDEEEDEKHAFSVEGRGNADKD